MSDHAKPAPGARCQNCGTELRGPFCHECGQQDFEFHQSFRHVFLEALENFAHFDAKFFRNIITLLFQPGRLTADFNAGRRASQMPPFRLYLFISVLFFFVRFLEPEAGDFGAVPATPAAAAVRPDLRESVRNAAEETPDTAAKRRLQALEEKLRNPALRNADVPDDQIRDAPPALARRIRRELSAGETQPDQVVKKSGLEPWIEIDQADEKSNSSLIRYLVEKRQFAFDHQREIQEAFVHALPRMLLLCLPLFALYTRLLFWRSGQVYLQHLIVALHYHTFVYLWWLVARGWNELAGLGSPGLAGVLAFGTGVWMFLYPFVMLRRLFGQSWTLTSFKALALTAVYGLTLSLGIALTAVVVFVTA